MSALPTDLNPDFEEAALEKGRLLFAGDIRFEKGVVHTSTLPDDGMSEIALAGRSNVGKSSLVNALTGRKRIAKTSNTPGRTRELNLFNIGDQLRLVDMPGYGYAQVSKHLVENWTDLIYEFLQGRAELRRVYVLIDSRHGITNRDAPVFDLLDTHAVSYKIVLTKMDKLKTGEPAKILAATQKALSKRPAAHPDVHFTSSEKGTGMAELRAELAALA